MAAPLTPQQSDRARQTLKDLIPKLGISPTATALGLRPVDLISLSRDRQEITPEIAQGVAELAKVTFGEQVLPPLDAAAVVASADPLPKRADAIELARKDGAREETIAAVLRNPPRGSESWSRFDWLVAIHDFEKTPPQASRSLPPTPSMLSTPPMIAPLSLAATHSQYPTAPVSVAPPIPMSSSASASSASPAGPYESSLTLYEFASLTMGLELLPHRTDDVYACFSLTSPDQRAEEHTYWNDYLSKSPKERRALPAMRERMRMHWQRFDGQLANPSATLPPISEQTPQPVTPPLPLVTYAAICAELRLTPHRSEDVFAFYGLPDPQLRTIVAEFWDQRRRTSPQEDQEFQRLFWEKHQQLEQQAMQMQTWRQSSAKLAG